MDSDNISNRALNLVNDARVALGVVSEGGSSLRIAGDIDEDHSGGMATTVVISIEGAEYAMYSTSSASSLQAYLRGFRHAMDLVGGSYAFKPLSQAAAARKKESICPWKEQANKYRIERFHEECSRLAAQPLTMSLDRIKKAFEAVEHERVPLARRSPRFAFQRNKYRTGD